MADCTLETNATAERAKLKLIVGDIKSILPKFDSLILNPAQKIQL